MQAGGEGQRGALSFEAEELVHQRVRRLAAVGKPPNEIGWRVGMTVEQVVEVLDGSPLALSAGDKRASGHGGGVHPMWGWDEPLRRQAFIARYRRGLRDTIAGKFYGR